LRENPTPVLLADDHSMFREGLARKLISYMRREDTGTREEQASRTTPRCPSRWSGNRR
jgi:hypothetical protein